MRGRKPVPTALKIARGNPGKRALNKDEPVIAPSSFAPPVGLPDRVLEVWNELVQDLIAAGVLTRIDRKQFTMYCHTVAEAQEIREGLARLPLRSKVARGLRSDLRKLDAQQLKIAVEFGFTPSSRSRVKVTKPPETGDAKRRRFFGVQA